MNRKNNTYHWLSLSIIVILFLLCGYMHSQDKLQFGTVRGHVTIINHPTLGNVPCSYCQFIIYRYNDKKAAIYMETDINGDYSITLSLGKWKIYNSYYPEGSLHRVNMLASGQASEFDLRRITAQGTLVFDIKLWVGDQAGDQPLALPR